MPPGENYAFTGEGKYNLPYDMQKKMSHNETKQKQYFELISHRTP